MLEIFNRAVVHARRIFIWKLRTINLHKTESDTLAIAGWENELIQKYLAWRRSMLIVVIPFAFSTLILDMMDIIQRGQEGGAYSGLNGLGLYVIFTPLTASLISFISVVLGLKWWTNYKYTSNCVLFGWMITLIMSLIPALLPIDFLLSNIGSIEQSVLEGIRVQLGILYALQVFPLIISVPFGIVRGALRIRGLLPESSLPGWFIILMAPLCPVLILAALFLLAQLYGNRLLVIGTACLAVAPLIYVIRRRLYTEHLTDVQEVSLEWTQRTIALLTSLGYIFIAFGAYNAGLFPVYSDIILFFVQWMNRNLTTGLAFSDSIFRVTLHQLRVDREGANHEIYYAEVDALLKSTENVDILNGGDDITFYTKEFVAGKSVDNTEKYMTNDSEDQLEDIEIQDWTRSDDVPSPRGFDEADVEEQSIPRHQPRTKLDEIGDDPGLNPPRYPSRY